MLRAFCSTNTTLMHIGGPWGVNTVPVCHFTTAKWKRNKMNHDSRSVFVIANQIKYTIKQIQYASVDRLMINTGPVRCLIIRGDMVHAGRQGSLFVLVEWTSIQLDIIASIMMTAHKGCDMRYGRSKIWNKEFT